jgi:peptidyl-prolyl cis-trans isomerase SurA
MPHFRSSPRWLVFFADNFSIPGRERAPAPLGSRLAVGMAACLLLLQAAGSAHAGVVERVVAVVGDKAILLSELQERAKPFEMQLAASGMEGPARANAMVQLYHDLTERLVDEELQARAATRSNISTKSEEVDRAVERLAQQNNVTVDELYAEATRSGLTRSDYRQELQRQLVEVKLLNLRTQGRIRVGEDDMRRAYERAVQDERQRLGFRAAWVHVPIAKGKADQARKVAQNVVEQARSGTPFAELAEQYSSDPESRSNGGLLPPMQPGQLAQSLDNALLALDVGQTSEPIRVGSTWIVLQLIERDDSQIPPYDQAKPQLQARVYSEKMEHSKRQWLRSLRRQTHVDVRL